MRAPITAHQLMFSHFSHFAGRYVNPVKASPILKKKNDQQNESWTQAEQVSGKHACLAMTTNQTTLIAMSSSKAAHHLDPRVCESRVFGSVG